MTLRLRSEVLDQEDHPESANDRDKNHEPPPGAQGCMDVRVVRRGEFAKEEEIVKDPNEGTKYHSSKARDDPYQQR